MRLITSSPFSSFCFLRGALRVEYALILNNMPVAAEKANSEDVPLLIKGRVTPVEGIRFVTTPIFTITCIETIMVMPLAK